MWGWGWVGFGLGGEPFMKPTFLKQNIPKCYFMFSGLFASNLPSYFFFFVCTVMIVYILFDVVCFACSKTCDRDMQVDRYNFIFNVNFFVNKLCLWKNQQNKNLV